MSEQHWFCTGCWDYVDVAPCPVCKTPADAILVLPARVAVDEADAEEGRWPTVDDLDYSFASSEER